MHYFKHSRDELLQDFCIVGDDVVCNLLRQGQNPLHSITKARGQLVIFVLFLQELNRRALLPTLIRGWRAQTSNVTLATPKTAFAIGFNYQVSKYCSFYVNMEQLTSAKTAPHLIALSTDFSVDPLISGEYFFSNPSSSWSDERKVSTYAKISNRRRGAVPRIRTVLLAENCTSREPLYFPMTTGSVLLSEDIRGLVEWRRPTHYGELVVVRTPIITEESIKVDDFAPLSVLCPN